MSNDHSEAVSAPLAYDFEDKIENVHQADIIQFPLRKFHITLGKRAADKYWTNRYEDDLSNIISAIVTHRQSEDKDGMCFVPGRFVGPDRVAGAVEFVDFLVLDVDGKQTIEDAAEKLEHAGVCAILYTTHSHGTNTTKVKTDEYQKWSENNGAPFPPDKSAIEDYLKTIGKGYLANVSFDLDCNDPRKHFVQDKAGHCYLVHHDPLHKFRAVLPLKHRLFIANPSLTTKKAIENFKDIYHAVGQALGLAYDTACEDPCRLYYTAANRPGHQGVLVALGCELVPSETGHFTFKDGLPTNLLDHTDEIRYPRLSRDTKSEPKPKAEAQPKQQPATGTTPSEVSQISISPRWMARYGGSFEIEKALPEAVKLGPRSGDNPGSVIQCPYEREHTTPSNNGTCVVNASENREHGFWVHCSHNSCKTARPNKNGNGVDRMLMLQGMVDNGWITREQLEDPELGGGPLSGKPSKESVRARIKLLTPASTSDDLRPIIDDIAALSDKLFDIEAVELINAARGTKAKTTLGAAINEARKSRNRDHESSENASEEASAAAERSGKLLLRDWTFGGEDAHSINTRVRNHFEKRNRETLRIYHRDIFPVRIARNASTGQLTIRCMDVAEFTAELDQHCVWGITTDDNRTKLIGTPRDIAEKILKCPELDLPVLRGVVDTPFFDKNGVLVVEPGYHEASGIYLEMARNGLRVAEVPLAPRDDDLAKAKAMIDDVYFDFPFHDGDDDPSGEASRTNTLARDITQFVRLMVKCVPFVATSKPGHDVGGTMLAKVGSIIATGEPPAIETVKENSREWQVAMHAHAMAGTRRICIDNVPRDYVIDDPNLAASATAERLSGRILGASEIGGGDVIWIFEFTGVNLKFSQENARRTIMIRLDAQMTSPGERDGFRHPDLIGWVTEHRGELVWAYLVLVQYWLSKGRPAYTGKPLSSFESWSRVVGGILQTAGYKKFNGNRHLLDSEDDRGMKELVAAWYDTFGEREVPCGTLEFFDEKMAATTLAELYCNLKDTGYVGVSRKQRDIDTLGQRLGNKLTEYVGSYYRINGADYRIVKRAARTGKLYALEPKPVKPLK